MQDGNRAVAIDVYFDESGAADDIGPEVAGCHADTMAVEAYIEW
jgi:hypothetical protein